MRRSDILFRAADRYPAAARSFLSAAACGYLPTGLLASWWGQELLRRLPETPLLSRINGEPFEVPPVAALFYRNFETETVKLLKALIEPSMSVVDVGANIGYLTVVAARSAYKGRVFAIEPGPLNRLTLERNLARHRISNVRVLGLAVGDRAGMVTLSMTEDRLNDSTAAEPATRVVRRIDVPQAKLDDLIQGPIDLVKIDVQGGEIAVLNGMEEMIRANPRLKVLVEWEPRYLARTGHKPADLLEALHGVGLSHLRVIDDHDGCERSVEDMQRIFAADETGERYCNILASRGDL